MAADEQGNAYEAQLLVRGLGTAWTAPAHLERLQAHSADSKEHVPCGHTLAARLWARVWQHARPKGAGAGATDSALVGSPRVEGARATKQYVKCASLSHCTA